MFHDEKTKYTKAVKLHTEENAPMVQGIESRGQDWHLDHIVPIRVGYDMGIPSEIIGSLENLQMLTRHNNITKANTITARGEQLLGKWGYNIEDVIGKIYTRPNNGFFSKEDAIKIIADLQRLGMSYPQAHRTVNEYTSAQPRALVILINYMRSAGIPIQLP